MHVTLGELGIVKMKMRKIAIIGYGYVGKAMTRFFQDHYNIVVYDPFYRGSVGFNCVLASSKDEVNACEVAVICVPTPRAVDGTCDISIVEKTISWLKTDTIILKSTVEVGTTDLLSKRYKKDIVFSPEYCGESSYWSPYDFHTDVKETPFFIFGGSKCATTKCVDLYMPVVGPTKAYRQTDSRSAEMAKYMENVFYSTKILFCYEMSEICRAGDIDYNEVRELWLLDPRINPMHTSVFSDNDRPFSGKCLPKDTAALVTMSEKFDYDSRFLTEVLRSNERLGNIREKRRMES